MVAVPTARDSAIFQGNLFRTVLGAQFEPSQRFCYKTKMKILVLFVPVLILIAIKSYIFENQRLDTENVFTETPKQICESN